MNSCDPLRRGPLPRDKTFPVTLTIFLARRKVRNAMAGVTLISVEFRDKVTSVSAVTEGVWIRSPTFQAEQGRGKEGRKATRTQNTALGYPNHVSKEKWKQQ